jgi:hypothetical protein
MNDLPCEGSSMLSESRARGNSAPLFFIVIVAAIVPARRQSKAEAKLLALMAPEERQSYELAKRQKRQMSDLRKKDSSDTWNYGNLSPQMLCPHCGVRGLIRKKPMTRKQGVSGGKATAAALTCGVLFLAVGLSRKEQNTQARCGN